MNKKMLRKKLALMLANLKKKRPFYTEVEYLQSTGTQYIDTGIAGSSTLKIEMYGQKAGASLGVYFGAGTGNNRIQAVYVSGYNSARIGDITVAQLGADTEKFNIVVDALNKNVIYNGTSYPFAYKSALTNLNIFIFTRNEGTALADKATARCWSFKIWDNGVLVRDFIPVLDWDMTPCMYDRVTEQLFYNQGTGDFTAGREIHQVEYIETDGTSYINTGYTPSGSTETEITTMLKDQTTSRFMFGCRSAQSSKTYACLAHNSNRIGYRVGEGSYVYSNGYNELNVKHTYKIANGVFYRDDVIVNTACQGATVSPNSPLALLTINTNNVLDTAQSFVGNFYSCTIKDNNVLVRDFIPAIDENGVGFVFDRVSHTIYDKAGTGVFSYPAREVEYIESDGNQYINLGFKVDNTYGFKVDYVYLNSNDRVVLGTKGSGDTRWCLSGSHNTNVNLSWNTSLGFAGLGLNKRQVAQMNYLNDRKRFLNDVELTPITETLASGAGTYNVCLFGAFWGSSTASLFSAVRLYSTQISKGTELFRDFIPVFCNGSAGVFDKVNEVFYPNAGTGTFTAGKIVEPEYE